MVSWTDAHFLFFVPWKSWQGVRSYSRPKETIRSHHTDAFMGHCTVHMWTDDIPESNDSADLESQQALLCEYDFIHTNNFKLLI